MEATSAVSLPLSPSSRVTLRPPRTDEELTHLIMLLTGLRVPDQAVCPGHVSPFRALADAYFARSSVSVWKASRGFGGKSTLGALLAHLEQVFLGADVTILGGSGEQSQRVHEALGAFWRFERAPRDLLVDAPTKSETRLSNGGRARALMASQTAVRGPHPQRLRLDECDEIKLELLAAALGQTMARPEIPAQTLMSS